MLRHIRNYPFSLLAVATVIYLSFFKAPSVGIDIPNLDKVAHFCMYMGLSGMLWIEFGRAHRRAPAPLWHAWAGAALCPVLFSGAVELLQAHCTNYRSGDWLDFAANCAGVALASLLGRWWVSRSN